LFVYSIATEKFTPSTIKSISWTLAYTRNIFVPSLLLGCVFIPSIRRSFAKSAVGHLGYVVVRLVPSFKFGSMYLNAEEKVDWVRLNSFQKLKLLLSLKYKSFLLELLSLTTLTVYFAYLRIVLLSYEVNCFLNEEKVCVIPN
jgi:hypothetical protein